MNVGLALFVIVGFIAVVLLLEGVYTYWNDTKSPEVKRVENRLRAISAGAHEHADLQLAKERLYSNSPEINRLLASMPRVHQLDRLIQQAGVETSVSHTLMASLLLAMAGLLGALFLRWPMVVAVLLAALLAALPFMRLVWKRRKRLQQMEAQLPDAMDLIGRALRAGHSFPSALAMVGSEAPEPIAGEFKIVSDEISFGIATDNALNNLAARVPNPDMRYFVMAVIIQRETGGNLSELLAKLSELVRERFKLFAKIRVLAAEGKLSGIILSLLPFAVAGVLMIVNPTYMMVLFRDPAGMMIVVGALIMMTIGIFFMSRIVDIRV